MTFVNCTIDTYLNLDFKDPEKLYFVSTNNAFGTSNENSAAATMLMFIGDTLIGNSSSLTRHSTNGYMSKTHHISGSQIETTYENNIINSINLNNNNIIPGTVKIYDAGGKEIFKDYYVAPNSGHDEVVGTGPVGGNAYLVKSNLSNDKPIAVGLIEYETGRISFNSNIISGSEFTVNDVTYKADNEALRKYNDIDELKFSYNDEISIINADVLSQNIPGVPGQTLFVIDEHKVGDKLMNTSTYMYYWYQPDDRSSGKWKNSNLNYTSQISIGDKTVDSLQLSRLLELLY